MNISVPAWNGARTLVTGKPHPGASFGGLSEVVLEFGSLGHGESGAVDQPGSMPAPTPLVLRDRGERLDQIRHVRSITSTSLISAPSAGSMSASRYSRRASAMFTSASSTVSPCDQQPGGLGTHTATPSFGEVQCDLEFHKAPTASESRRPGGTLKRPYPAENHDGGWRHSRFGCH